MGSLLVIAAAGRGAWRLAQAAAIAPAISVEPEPRQAAMIDRYAALGEVLSGVPRARYIAGPGRPDGEVRLVAGLFALPTVLTADDSEDDLVNEVWVIDALDTPGAWAIAEARGLRVAQEVAPGLLVVAAEPGVLRSLRR